MANNKNIKWTSYVLAIDIETGEILNRNSEEFKQYEIIKKTKKYNIINYEVGRIEHEWQCQRTKYKQGKLEI